MRFRITLCVIFSSAALLRADFSYQQTSRMTGGTMMSFAKLAGGKLTQPIVSTIAIKGNQMVHATAQTSSIIDLDAQTITTVNFDRKSYSVMRFDDMKKMLESTASGTGPSVSDIKVDVKDGAGEKKILNFNTHEKILSMAMTVADARSDAKMETQIASDMYIAKGVEGAEKLHAFYRRMGKFSWSPGGMPGGNRPEMMKAMAEIYRSSSTLDGLPLLTVISVSGAIPGMPAMGAMPAENGTSPSGSDAAANALGGKLGGIAAMLARKRQKQQEAEDSTSSTATHGAPGALMEMTMEVTSYSTKPVDAALFRIPAGFTKTDAAVPHVPPAR